MDKPPFLKGSTASSGKPDPSPNRPQPSKGGEPGSAPADKFPNRPQPMGAPKGNPQSVPGGGTLPFKGPSVPTQSPFKVGK